MLGSCKSFLSHDSQHWLQNWCVEFHILIVCFYEATRFMLTSSMVESQEQIVVITYTISDDWRIIPLDWHGVQAIVSHNSLWWTLGTWRWYLFWPRSILGRVGLRPHTNGLCHFGMGPHSSELPEPKRSAQDIGKLHWWLSVAGYEWLHHLFFCPVMYHVVMTVSKRNGNWGASSLDYWWVKKWCNHWLVQAGLARFT